MKKTTVMTGVLCLMLLSGCTGRGAVEYRAGSEAFSAGSLEDKTTEAGNQTPDLEQNSEEADPVPEEAVEKEQPRTLYVDISGAVNCPGVYELAEGDRVFHAVAAAGGFTDQAEVRCVNQADLLTDGQKIYIYSLEETEQLGGWMQLTGSGVLQPAAEKSGNTSSPDSGKVNLNLADKSQLMTLAGVGEARADAIISYRETNGAFSSIEDIMKVSGIKEKLFEQIQDSITV